MVRKIVAVMICISSLILLFGCGNNDADPGSENEITIEVANKTEKIIISFALFYGPNLDEWGEDLLQDEVIEPGEAVSFVLPEGEYSMIPMTFEYYVLPITRNITDDQRIEVGAEGKEPLLFTNDTEVDIGFVYISPSESEDWGENWLGDEVIATGISKFFFIEPDIYDLMVVDMEREAVLELYEMEIDGERHFVIRDTDEDDDNETEVIEEDLEQELEED